jgi:LPXTG-motif cell wall-anchored protein
LSSKTVTFSDHFSTYIVDTGYTPATATPNPKTGSENTPIVLFGILFVVTLGALIITKQRKKWQVKKDKAV